MNNGDDYRDTEVISAKWRKMRPVIAAFNQIFTRVSNSRQSGADDATLQTLAQEEYRGTYGGGQAFKYLAIWQVLRLSSKFNIVIDLDTFAHLGQPSAKRSKTSSSAEQQSQGSDARCNINLNDIEEDAEEEPREVDPRQQLQRPIGRDRAKKAAQSSSSGGRVDYTDTIQQMTTRLDGLLQTNQERLNHKKEIAQKRLELKQSRQQQRDFQFLTTDTSHLTGPELAMALQMKQQIREKYNL